MTYSHPYSVATGVQASGLAGLYAITGEERYRAAAERAGLFLARSVLGPGQIRFHAHDREEPLIHGPERMGELFYLLEGMIWSARCSGPEASQEISDALQRFLSEVRDSFLETSAQEWVAQGSTWEMSKRAGLLYLLVQMEALSAQDPTEISDGLLACLSNSLCSVRAGVLCNPAAPKGRFALVATGFAGLGMASLVELEALFPERLQRPSR